MEEENSMKKKIISIILTAALGCSLAACGSSSESSSSNESTTSAESASSSEETVSNSSASSAATTSETLGEANGKYTISVILKTLNSQYWSVVAAGAKQAATDFGVTVKLQGPPSETSYDEQMNMIETTLNAGDSDALVLAPLQPDTAANLVQNATIPVLAVDTTFESDKLISYIGLSNEDAAKAGGEYVAEKLGGSGNAVILAGVQGDNTSEDRIKGWKEGLESGGCTVLESQYTNAVADQAATTVEGMLQNYPDQIDAIVCHSDDVAMGAAQAVKSAGLQDKIMIVGFGGISGAEPVKEGTLTATIDIGPYEMGYNCVKYAIDAIEGKQIEEFYPTTPEIIDQENVDDFLEKLDEWTK